MYDLKKFLTMFDPRGVKNTSHFLNNFSKKITILIRKAKTVLFDVLRANFLNFAQ